ncbi:MAG: hypothetical protein ACYS47_14585 [Planctomycetota bacterium]|jgi:hypothetical protein
MSCLRFRSVGRPLLLCGALALLLVSCGRHTSDGPDPDPALVPVNLGAIPGDGTVTLHWNAQAGGPKYHLYWSTVPGVQPSTGTKIADVVPPHVHSSLTNGVTYHYVVTAEDGAGETGPSSEARATPANGPAAAGLHWSTAATHAPWVARHGHSSTVFNGRMWVLGGDSWAVGRELNDVWSTADGATWTEITPAASWSARRGHSTVVHDTKIWVIGGQAG